MKVSVCIITYNHEAFIAQAIEGALMQQTNFDYEIVIGEDESQDRTRDICVEYAQRYPEKIRLFLRSRKDIICINGRPTGRYNFVETVKAARGKYIALCDGDDYWTDPHKLQKQVDFLEAHPDYVLCHHDAKIVDQHGNRIKDSKLPSSGKRDFTAEELAKGAWVLTLSACFRNVLHEYPAEFLKVANGDTFLFSMLGNYGKAKYLGDVIEPAVYRVHPGGIWSSQTDQSRRALSSLKTSYWLRIFYARTGKPDISLNFARKLFHTQSFFQLLSSEQIEAQHSYHKDLLETDIAQSAEAPPVVDHMMSCLSGNLEIAAALAHFVLRSWMPGKDHLSRAIGLDPEAWLDGETLERLLALQVFAETEEDGFRDVTRINEYANGINRHIGGGNPLPQGLEKRIIGRLYAEAAYRSHLARSTSHLRRYTLCALKANPRLFRDIGMLRRGLGV